MSQAAHDTTILESITEFYRLQYQNAIAELAQRYPKDQESLWVDYKKLYKYDMALADDMLNNPKELISHFKEALHNFDLPADVNLDGARVRVYNLPETRTYTVGEYRSDNINEYLSIYGQVSKKTQVHPLPTLAVFECQRCGTETENPQNDDFQVQEPHECQACERAGPFLMNRNETEWKDVQMARLELPPEESKGNGNADIDVLLENDLTDDLEAGDRAQLSGRLVVDEPSDSDIGYIPKLEANGYQIEESDYSSVDIDTYEEQIKEMASGEYGDPYELLIQSIGPTVIGKREIKEALALQLFGGAPEEFPSGTTGRGDIHVLLLGDPGTAKSTLLEDVEEIAPCSTATSGKGATAAGMTASAVKDDFGGNQWTLEAGALVLADGGIACIDELDKVPDEVVSSMHKALSKQSINVNKAGINATLPTRTSLLAAGNPTHGRFIEDQLIADQIDLAPTMLSRFDLMFMMHDEPDPEEDARIIDGMIENHRQGVQCADPSEHDPDTSNIQAKIKREPLRAWIAYAKENIYPRIEDDDVEAELRESFQTLRMMNGDDEDAPIPVTPRKLEAILRLASASARVRLSNEIEMQDVDRARRLIGRSMRDVGMDPETGQLDADVIHSGTSKSQREKRNWLRDTIQQLEGDEPVPRDLLQDKAEEESIPPKTFEHHIGKLKEKGEIYEAKSDHYRRS